MRNKTKSGQRGICVRMAYLVMRNESSRGVERIEDEEKTRQEERTRNHLPRLEERKKGSRLRNTGNKLWDPKQLQGGHLLCQLLFLPRVRMLIRSGKRSWEDLLQVSLLAGIGVGWVTWVRGKGRGQNGESIRRVAVCSEYTVGAI